MRICVMCSRCVVCLFPLFAFFLAQELHEKHQTKSGNEIQHSTLCVCAFMSANCLYIAHNFASNHFPQHTLIDWLIFGWPQALFALLVLIRFLNKFGPINNIIKIKYESAFNECCCMSYVVRFNFFLLLINKFNFIYYIFQSSNNSLKNSIPLNFVRMDGVHVCSKWYRRLKVMEFFLFFDLLTFNIFFAAQPFSVEQSITDGQ